MRKLNFFRNIMDRMARQDLGNEQQRPLETNPKPIISVALIGLVVAFGSFLLWALIAPLDEGVVANGVVAVGSNKKAIQHQYGGTIKEILVVEGSRVKKGQVLARLNEAQPKANLSNVRSEYYTAMALEARLRAERSQTEAITFPQELTQMSHLPEVAEQINTQQELFNARRGSLQSELTILKDNIDGMREYIRRLQELQTSLATQMELLSGEMASLRNLADQGYYPRTRVLEMERILADLSGKRSEDLGNIAKARMMMSEYQTKISQRKLDFLQDVETRLSEAQKKLVALKDQYAASLDVLENTEIKAPEDGTVVGLEVHTTGEVIMPGKAIMYIVPADEELIVEAKVMTSDRDRIQEKFKVDLRFPAFDVRTTPVIDGEVALISADRFTDEATKIPYYHCRIQITPEGIRQLGNRNLQPGMPVQVVIKTGERTLMNYLLKPFSDRIAISFKEK